jgi:hypothetical protein
VATDSPVNIASSMRSSRTSISRRSAGTLSPERKYNVSPGTSPQPAPSGVSASHDGGFQGEHACDRLERLLRFPFLNESDERIDDYHAQDDARVDPVFEQRVAILASSRM